MSYLELPDGEGTDQEGFVPTPGTSALLHVASSGSQHSGLRVVGLLTWQLASKGVKAEAVRLLRVCHRLVKASH